MTDLVERLRAWAGARTVHAAMASEAADEIERLLAKVNELDGMWRSADKGGQAEIERLRAERALSMSTASGLALDAAAKDDEIERLRLRKRPVAWVRYGGGEPEFRHASPEADPTEDEGWIALYRRGDGK